MLTNIRWWLRYTPWGRFRSFLINRVLKLRCAVCGWSLDPLAHHDEYVHNSAAEWERRAKESK